MATPTKHHTNPQHQGSCKFGGTHLMTMPIYRNGQQVSPIAGPDDEDWAECGRCGRIEDETGAPVADPPFGHLIR